MYDGPSKMTKKKLIEIIILVLIIIWILILMINYIRYTREAPPILSLHTTSVCDDGTIDSYAAFGYTYRKYSSTSTNYSEFVPFWVPAKTCKISNGLPATYTDYAIPKNDNYVENYRGLVYLYRGTHLYGAYKCINTDECTMARSGYDQYNISNTDPLTKLKSQPSMAILYDRFAFIDDSLKQDGQYGDEQFVRTVYYYDSLNNVLLARFSDVKHAGLNDDYKGIGDWNNYIMVRNFDTMKWGLVEFKKDGSFENILDFEYDSINFNDYTGYYILKKGDTWSIYDLENKTYVLENCKDVIYDVWENNNKSFFYTIGNKATDKEGNDYIEFKIRRLDGESFLDVPSVWSIVHSKYIIMYWVKDDNTLHFRDYVADNRILPIKLKFAELDTENNHFNPAFTYKFGTNYKGISLNIYEGRELNYSYNSYYISIHDWE